MFGLFKWIFGLNGPRNRGKECPYGRTPRTRKPRRDGQGRGLGRRR